MSTQPQGKERRRGDRVLIRVPIRLRAIGTAQPAEQEAETVVVSRHGALLRSPTPMTSGSTIEIRHGVSRQVETFRVVWVSPKAQEGQHDIGVECVNPLHNFWGIRFPPQRA